MKFGEFYLIESSKYLGQCDKIRRTKEGEDFWQNVMNNKKSITERQFLKNVDPSNLFDDGENWEDFKYNHSDDGIKYFKTDDVYFIQIAGFEFFWKVEN